MIATWKPSQFVPALPSGRKQCATCLKLLRTTDEHRRCQKCRNGDLALKYTKTCRCGVVFVAQKIDRYSCSLPCARKAGAETKKKRGGTP